MKAASAGRDKERLKARVREKRVLRRRNDDALTERMDSEEAQDEKENVRRSM